MAFEVQKDFPALGTAVVNYWAEGRSLAAPAPSRAPQLGTAVGSAVGKNNTRRTRSRSLPVRRDAERQTAATRRSTQRLPSAFSASTAEKYEQFEELQEDDDESWEYNDGAETQASVADLRDTQQWEDDPMYGTGDADTADAVSADAGASSDSGDYLSEEYDPFVPRVETVHVDTEFAPPPWREAPRRDVHVPAARGADGQTARTQQVPKPRTYPNDVHVPAERVLRGKTAGTQLARLGLPVMSKHGKLAPGKPDSTPAPWKRFLPKEPVQHTAGRSAFRDEAQADFAVECADEEDADIEPEQEPVEPTKTAEKAHLRPTSKWKPQPPPPRVPLKPRAATKGSATAQTCKGALHRHGVVDRSATAATTRPPRSPKAPPPKPAEARPEPRVAAARQKPADAGFWLRQEGQTVLRLTPERAMKLSPSCLVALQKIRKRAESMVKRSCCA